MTNSACRLRLVQDEVDSTAEESSGEDLQLERLLLDYKPNFIFYRGTREAFDALYAKTLSEHKPELVANFPTVNVEEDTYGFIAGTVIMTTRDRKPYIWAALPGVGHWFIEQMIIEHGTPEEVSRVHQYKRCFITNTGRVVSRVAARAIAFDANQILPKRAYRQELFSDDLWNT